MKNKFKVGNKVKRICCDHKGIKLGKTYIVEKIHGHNALYVKGYSCLLASSNFILANYSSNYQIY